MAATADVEAFGLSPPPLHFQQEHDDGLHYVESGLGGYPHAGRVECAGREYVRRCRNVARGRTLSYHSTDAEEVKRSADKLAEEKILADYQQRIAGKDFLSLTMYQQLGLDDLGFDAEEEHIRKAYHRVLIEHHPDKTGRTENDPNYLAVQKAFNTLMDADKRRAYDSTCDFDESIPTGREVIQQHNMVELGGNGRISSEGMCFYDLYGPVFARNARFSKTQPVPPFGDASTAIDEVYDFYDFWLKFDSWRDFSHDSEHDAESAQHRDEKRWMMKKNEAAAKKKKKKEYSRLSNLVERAMAADPRIRKQKYDEKMAKVKAKKEKEEKERQAAMAIKAKEEEIARKIEEAETLKKEQAKSEKLQREKAKKVLRKAKKLFRELMEACRNTQGVENAIDILQTESICDKLSLEELQGLNAKLGNSTDQLNTDALVDVIAHLD